MQMTQEWKESEEEERLVTTDIVKNQVTNFQEAHWRENLVGIV